MADVARSVNFIDMDPLWHFLCCKMNFLIGCNVVWEALLADKPFCEFTDSGAGRNIIRSKGWSVFRICDYSNKDEFLPPQWWKRSSIINLLSDSWFTPWERVPYQELNVIFCSWQIRHLTVVTRWALVKETSRLLSTCRAWVLTTMAILLKGPLSKPWMAG